MTMKKGVFICALGLLAYIRSASAILETVWLKDVTTRLQIDKRTLSDLDLPNELAFHLRRGSETLSLNLKRNHDINPNANVYFVRKLKDGQSVLVKARNLEKEDVAYYQDRENGAFVTVGCVKKSNELCDRVINGNIRIGDNTYDLRPEENDATSKNLLEIPGLLGKRYVLQDQANIQRESLVENKDAVHLNEKKVEQELKALQRRFEGQHKQNNVPPSDSTLSSQNVPVLHNRAATDKSRQVKVYHVKIAVLIDSTVWDLYSSMIYNVNPITRNRKVDKKIRGVYSHIVNGINMIYREIQDTSISINIFLADFIYFKSLGSFPHNISMVKIDNGIDRIDALHYLSDIVAWDVETGMYNEPIFDHGMLFTRYKLYIGSFDSVALGGISLTGNVCDIGYRTSVIEAHDYLWTVSTAAHELGHNLGAIHDGDAGAENCKAEDLFLMTPEEPDQSPDRPYNRNSWIFSNCSVQAFKDTLKNKKCVTIPGAFYDEPEYRWFLKKELGEVYTPDEQCHFIRGQKSVRCETEPANICHLLRCTYPDTGICGERYFGAARGTECGPNKNQAAACHTQPCMKLEEVAGIPCWIVDRQTAFVFSSPTTHMRTHL